MIYSNDLIYLEVPEAIPLLIEHGYLSLEEADGLNSHYDAFKQKLDAEWTPTRTKEFLLNQKRNLMNWAYSKIKTVELENQDARKRGVSFKERQKYSTQVETLKKMWHQTKREGVELAQQPMEYFMASRYVRPLDVATVVSQGFEHFLKFNF